MLAHLKTSPAERGARVRERALHRLAIERGVMPEHYREPPADFSDFGADDPELAALGVRLLQRGAVAGLLLKGGAGRGKSRFVGAVVRTLLLAAGADARTAAASIRVLPVRTLLDDVWAAPFERRRAVLARYENTPLLILEDLGLEGAAGESTIEILHTLLTVRNGFERTTLVTSNLRFEEIETRYGETIASRMSVWRQYTMRGADRRRA